MTPRRQCHTHARPAGSESHPPTEDSTGLLGEAAGPGGQAGTWDEPGAPGGARKSGSLHSQGRARPRDTGAKRKGPQRPRPERTSHRIKCPPRHPGSLPTARTHTHTHTRLPPRGERSRQDSRRTGDPGGRTSVTGPQRRREGQGKERPYRGAAGDTTRTRGPGPASRDVARTAGTATREKRATSAPGCAFPGATPRCHPENTRQTSPK